MTKDICTIEDVSDFIHCILEEGVNAHPDEDFCNYVNVDTGEDTYTPEEASERNNLLAKCFGVCEKEGIDIYDLMQEIFLKGTGMDKLIPLPSQNIS